MAYNLATVLPYGALLAPIALNATSVGFTSFTCNWLKTHAVEYYIDIAEDSGFTIFLTGYENLLLGDIDSLQVTGVSEDTTYYYRLRAKYGDRTSINSNIITLTTMHGDMFPPVALPATSITQTSFVANWEPVGGPVTNYILYVATDSAFTNHVNGYNGLDVGLATSYNVTGLSEDTQYYYRLTAKYTE